MLINFLYDEKQMVTVVIVPHFFKNQTRHTFCFSLSFSDKIIKVFAYACKQNKSKG